VHAVDHRGHGRSVTSPDELGSFDFPALVADVAAYGAALGEQSPEPPLFLLAHSMGSFAAQAVLLDHSEQYAGVVLSGSTALDVLAAELSKADGPVGLEAFNAGFEHRTGYEWLSRDEAEVDAYVADPLSGFDLPDDAVPQLFAGAMRLADPRRWPASVTTCRS
jgi:alpha-beta hydrolase superfamily lysophospholipase